MSTNRVLIILARRKQAAVNDYQEGVITDDQYRAIRAELWEIEKDVLAEGEQ